VSDHLLRVALVQRRSKGERNRLPELKELAIAAGYNPVLLVEQVREPDPKYNIGRGKVKELKELIKSNGVTKVIFHNDLKPSQVHNLMKEWGVEVIDRFQLILEIFSKRAGSKEAKLQIELARLKRELSFIKERIHLLRKEEFAGFMGGGRYEIDAHYRHAVSRIARIERTLKEIRRKKRERVKARSIAGLSTIALTGYTGAGKTTLFNKLTGEEGYIDGKPFATLSTTVRRTVIKGYKVLVADTIGFIEDLPPLLIDAFYTTLEEVSMADLILLVIDGSEELNETERKIHASMEALETVGVHKSKLLGALNKIDLIGSSDEIARRVELVEEWTGIEVVPISAMCNVNLNALKDRIISKMPGYVRAKIKLPINDFSYSLASKMLENACILNEVVNNGVLEIDVECKKEWLLRFVKEVSSLGGGLVLQ